MSGFDKYQSILRQYWGYPDFLGIQRDIIESITQGKDTLGLMPTGGGKSITFQVPALAVEGVCIVITPLIALMKDQVSHLRNIGIQASAIYSGMTHGEVLTTLDNCVFGGVKILYVSPERLSTNLFQVKIKHIKVSFITVDEAHCISQWGYDFQPSYLKIAEIRSLLPNIPILALTATATQKVVDDIQDKLQFAKKNVFNMSFERKNLAYIVRETLDKEGELIHILNSIKGCAIVYVRSRKHTKELAKMLNEHNFEATFYHAGLDFAVKDQRQKDWQEDKTRVIVATNAFGMGIDKSDVRLVVHIDCPDSVEEYFQEAGRAGRDGLKSYAVLLYNSSDKRKLEKRISDTFPEKDYIREVYEHLAYFFQIGIGSGIGYTFEFDIEKFCSAFHHFPLQVDSSLKILARAGYFDYETDPDTSSRVMFLLQRNELYKLYNSSPNEELVITSLLRKYGGLFTDFCYIEEAFIAQDCGLTKQQVYLILKNLSQKHILRFVPRHKIPYITYLKDRDDGDKIIIPPSVYEERKEQFTERVHSVIIYATNGDVCRSRQLLRYFGEFQKKDCGQCDVCLSHKKDPNEKKKIELAKEAIKAILSDGNKHFVTEINDITMQENIVDIALENLISEEEIHIDDCFLSL